MTSPTPTGWFTGRTKYITIASIIAVGAAGAVAVAANIGILNAAGDSGVGTLSATGDLAPPSSQVVDVYLDPTTNSTIVTTAAAPAGGGQEFAVDAAGTATVSSTASGLRLDNVKPTPGWTWSLVQPGPTQLNVSFTNGTRTLEFVATAAADGTVSASVDEPILTAAAPAPNGGHEGESHEGGGEDD